jgi:hypothetical protein
MASAARVFGRHTADHDDELGAGRQAHLADRHHVAPERGAEPVYDARDATQRSSRANRQDAGSKRKRRCARCSGVGRALEVHHQDDGRRDAGSTAESKDNPHDAADTRKDAEQLVPPHS